MRTRVILVVAGLLVVVGLPLAGKWARRHAPPRCARDGLPIEASYRVRVEVRGGESLEFCCVECAVRWHEHQSERPAVYVTDEAGGGEIDARSAHFVRSMVVTNPVTGNRVHAFRDRAAAEEHARIFHGRVLRGADRPFGK